MPDLTMKELLMYSLLVVYIVFSLVHSISFYKNDIYFSQKRKIFTVILIWLIPFIYAFLIEDSTTLNKGSNHYDKKVSLGQKRNDRIPPGINSLK